MKQQEESQIMNNGYLEEIKIFAERCSNILDYSPTLEYLDSPSKRSHLLWFAIAE